ncbi:MAG: SAM-dependent methyltransferase [Verrucomicrobia bacterium]|nr:SAM-dependent methyltransferase [Verrucomicrobiota bacterium]
MMMVEKEIRLSKSLLWHLQKNAYREFGPECWTKKGVPLHVTSNRTIASTYAKIAAHLLKREPQLTILEMGGGSGRFAYLFLNELMERWKKPFRYLLTDLAEKNVAFWKQHPLFQPYLKNNLLELRAYNPLEDPPPEPGPFLILANYFFDSIPQDLFQKKRGKLFEGKVSLSIEKPNDPFNGIEAKYSYHPAQMPYYRKPSWDALLENEPDGTFLFPVGALETLEKFPEFYLLAADKGYRKEKQLSQWKDPQLNLHGTISFPVNFYLLEQFVKMRGGDVIFGNDDPILTVGLFSSKNLHGYSFSFTPCIEEPKIDLKFFPLCREEALRFYEIPGEEAERLAELCQDLPSIQKPIQTKGKVLQIGAAPTKIRAEQTLALNQVEPWPLKNSIFDEIYFFAPPIRTRTQSSLERQGGELVRQIEQEIPQIRHTIYSDADINLFFESPKPFSTPAQYIRFFAELEERKQITASQKEAALARLEKEGLIRSTDRVYDPSQNEDALPLFEKAVHICLERHMNEKSVLFGYFPGIDSLPSSDAFVADPWIDYSEEFSSGTLRVQIKKAL